METSGEEGAGEPSSHVELENGIEVMSWQNEERHESLND